MAKLTQIKNQNQEMIGFIFRGKVYFEEDTPQATYGNVKKYTKIFKVIIVEDLQARLQTIKETDQNPDYCAPLGGTQSSQF